MDDMTIKETRTLIEKYNRAEWTHESLKRLDLIIADYQKRMEDKSITRDEEVLYWMYIKGSDFADADRWTAINRGEIKFGKQEDGSIID